MSDFQFDFDFDAPCEGFDNLFAELSDTDLTFLDITPNLPPCPGAFADVPQPEDPFSSPNPLIIQHAPQTDQPYHHDTQRSAPTRPRHIQPSSQQRLRIPRPDTPRPGAPRPGTSRPGPARLQQTVIRPGPSRLGLTRCSPPPGYAAGSPVPQSRSTTPVQPQMRITVQRAPHMVPQRAQVASPGVPVCGRGSMGHSPPGPLNIRRNQHTSAPLAEHLPQSPHKKHQRARSHWEILSPRSKSLLISPPGPQDFSIPDESSHQPSTLTATRKRKIDSRGLIPMRVVADMISPREQATPPSTAVSPYGYPEDLALPPKKRRKTASSAGIFPVDSPIDDPPQPSTKRRMGVAGDDEYSTTLSIKPEDIDLNLSSTPSMEQKIKTELEEHIARRAHHAVWVELERRNWKKREADTLAKLKKCRRRLRELENQGDIS